MDSLPPPDVLATEIADGLAAALEQFRKIAAPHPLLMADDQYFHRFGGTS